MLCAEFPDEPSSDDPDLPADLEGFFNATPADAEGNVLTDPAQWADPRMIEHPRVALIDTDTGRVISTWDRVACSRNVDYEPLVDPDWPPSSTAIVDMDTGALVDMYRRS